jgi:hypothetical protein
VFEVVAPAQVLFAQPDRHGDAAFLEQLELPAGVG